MEVKVQIKDIENLKTITGIKVDKDKDGNIADRYLITKIQFEAQIDPAELANIHRLLAGDASVNVVMGSPQTIMELEREPVLAGAK